MKRCLLIILVPLLGALPFSANAQAPAASAAPAEAPLERVTLDEAVDRALKHNPSSRAAVATVKVAYGQMEEIRSNSFPTLYANGNYTRLDHNRYATIGGVTQLAEPANQLNGNLTLTLPLLAPRAWANWARAVDQVDVSRLSFADTERLVALATARAYLTVYAEHLAVKVSLVARENAKAHLSFAQKRLSGGIGNRIDAVRAAQEVASDEAFLRNAQANLDQARETLGVLMGVDGKAVDVTDEPPEGQLPASPPLDVAVKRARGERSDVKVAEIRAEAADHSLNLTYTDYLPSLAFVFQPFLQNFTTAYTPTAGWQAQLLLTIPLYDGSLRYGLTHEREGLLTQAQLNKEGTIRQAESDARGAFAVLEHANASWIAARDAARLAHEALQLADLAYRAGATNELDVIDAERQARDADTAAASAEDNMLQAELNLLNAAALFPKS
jgi:outer membrane protein TolC